jgi:hypothetical protein
VGRKFLKAPQLAAGIFTAEAGEKLVGFVHVIVRDSPGIPVFTPWSYAMVDKIVVRSGYQSHVISRRWRCAPGPRVFLGGFQCSMLRGFA